MPLAALDFAGAPTVEPTWYMVSSGTAFVATGTNVTEHGVVYGSQFGTGSYGILSTNTMVGPSMSGVWNENRPTLIIPQIPIVGSTAPEPLLLNVDYAAFPNIFALVKLEDELTLVPQEEGGYVAYSKEYPGAIGQGETEEEALHDLKEATDLLKEALEQDRSQCRVRHS